MIHKKAHKYDTYAVIILAAGKSKRMGSPKPLLKLPNGLTFIENICSGYFNMGFKNIIVVTRIKLFQAISELFEHSEFNPEIIINKTPELGQVSSVKCGVNASKHKNVFIHNIDTPVVNEKLIQAMSKILKHNCYVQCNYKGVGGHPVLISNQISAALTNLNNYNLSLRQFLANYSKIIIESDSQHIITNINTKDDYNAFLGCF